MAGILLFAAILQAGGPSQRSDAPRDLLRAVVEYVRELHPTSGVLLSERAAVTAPLPLPHLRGPACGTAEAARHTEIPCGADALASLPPGLADVLRHADTASGLWTAADVPDGAKFLSDSAQRAFAASGRAGFWTAVSAQFPSHYIVAVSPFQLAADGRGAVATVSMRCGPLCGRGVYAILVRDDSRGWTVVRLFTAWRS